MCWSLKVAQGVLCLAAHNQKRQGQEGIDRSLTRLQQGQVHEALKLWHAELCVKDLPMPPGFSHQTQVSHDDSTTCAAAMQAKVEVRCLKVALDSSRCVAQSANDLFHMAVQLLKELEAELGAPSGGVLADTGAQAVGSVNSAAATLHAARSAMHTREAELRSANDLVGTCLCEHSCGCMHVCSCARLFMVCSSLCPCTRACLCV